MQRYLSIVNTSHRTYYLRRVDSRHPHIPILPGSTFVTTFKPDYIITDLSGHSTTMPPHRQDNTLFVISVDSFYSPAVE